MKKHGEKECNNSWNDDNYPYIKNTFFHRIRLLVVV